MASSQGLFRVASHRVPAQHIREYPRATANSQEEPLELAVKQYTPRSNPDPQPGDVTFIAATANGFPKELYEPLWEELLARSERAGDWRIRSIWIADVAWQGESYALNEHRVGNDPGWNDHSRDLLHLVNLMRHDMPRPLVGIGHSMGGAHLVNLALIHPRLLTSVVLIDPVIQPQSAEIDQARQDGPHVAQLSTFRRNLWASRDAAAAGFRTAPFYRTWDPRVVAKLGQFGLRDTPTLLQPDAAPPQVTLSTTPAQEVFTFLRPNYAGYGVDGKPIDRRTHADLDPSRPLLAPFYRPEPVAIFHRLPELRPSALYVFGETSEVSRPKTNETKLAQTGIGVGGSGGVKDGRVKGVTLKGVGHMIPMEAVSGTADAVSEWVASEMMRFRKEQNDWEQNWKAKSLREKQDIDNEWRHMMGGAPKKPKL